MTEKVKLIQVTTTDGVTMDINPTHVCKMQFDGDVADVSLSCGQHLRVDRKNYLLLLHQDANMVRHILAHEAEEQRVKQERTEFFANVAELTEGAKTASDAVKEFLSLLVKGTRDCSPKQGRPSIHLEEEDANRFLQLAIDNGISGLRVRHCARYKETYCTFHGANLFIPRIPFAERGMTAEAPSPREGNQSQPVEVDELKTALQRVAALIDTNGPQAEGLKKVLQRAAASD